jgi:hypothetical protein
MQAALSRLRMLETGMKPIAPVRLVDECDKPVAPPDTADAMPCPDEKWSRPARFLFIIAATATCWFIPAFVVYLVLRD